MWVYGCMCVVMIMMILIITTIISTIITTTTITISYKNPIGTSTIKAATDSTLTTPMPYKMFRVISIFHLIRTVGLDKTVFTWGHSTTSATSMYDANTGVYV